jgi:hypothetical protein
MATLKDALKEALKQNEHWQPSSNNHETGNDLFSVHGPSLRRHGGVPLDVYLSHQDPKLFNRINAHASDGVISPDVLLQLEAEDEGDPGNKV